ncbi:MAG: hypothetical protein DCC68_03930 [Planctomycetota bacterium]|nr:MAG: hypothetical protein DCC68_03930 [Planctomycetota bacterium]
MRVHAPALLAVALALFASFVRADEPQKEARDAMQGTWTIESFTLNGNEVDPGQLKNWRRIVERNHVTWKNGDQTMIELEIKFDPSQAPHTLDSTIKTGESSGHTLLAIYEFKDDKLTVCFANPGDARPKEFSSKPESGQSLYVARRVKK